VKVVRYAAAVVCALSFTTATGGPLTPFTSAAAGPLVEVAVERVRAYVPPSWEYRPIPGLSDHIQGLQASRNLDRWSERGERGPGINAFWVDATSFDLPSDFYMLAARGPAIDAFRERPHCRADGEEVLLSWVHGRDRSPSWPGGYVTTATGTCQGRDESTRWAAFVAAPGFSEVRSLGIPQSGMYVALASVPAGPHDEVRLDRMLRAVTFGDTSISEFLRTVGAAGPLV
jgi:hypothetical protein